MKQTQFFIIFFIICFSFLGCGATKQAYITKDSNVIDTAKYKCVYQFKFLEDSINMKYKDNDLYVIQIGENFTKSYCYQLFYFDSINNIPRRGAKDGMGEYIVTNYPADGIITPAFQEGLYKFTTGYWQFYVFKDYIKEKITVTEQISAYHFMYDDELKPQDWIIMKDTMTILEYSCQKAICSFRDRNWVAWFTSEIPISEGPYKFCGLPGLILKLEDAESHFSFEINNFQKVNEPIHMYIDKYSRKMDRISFLKLKMNRTGTDLTAMDGAKVGLVISNEKQHDHIERDYK